MFAKFKALAGQWKGTSAEGAAERVTYDVIADGSCVMETFEFVGKPEQKMVTMYHQDGDRLMLTHYCMAKNQPRMRATQIGPDASEITFTFIDATNLLSRDTGHMDKAVYTFKDADHYSSRWTWYEAGKESWMEQSTYERIKP